LHVATDSKSQWPHWNQSPTSAVSHFKPRQSGVNRLQNYLQQRDERSRVTQKLLGDFTDPSDTARMEI